MIKSIEKLRGEIQVLRDNNIDTDELVRIADAIEREVEERYIELPKDADGFTIAPLNDMVDSNGEPFVVSSIEMLANGVWCLHENGKLGSKFATMCRHHRPPTVEGVLRVFAARVRNEAMKFERVSDETIAEYAAKFQLREAEQC